MAKILPILNIVTRVLLGLVLLTALVLNLSMAYIMFAPDSLPKPFYLMYQDPNGTLPIVQSESPVTVAQQPVAEPTPTFKPGEGVMLNTGTKIVNLAEATGSKYIRVTIVLEFAPHDPTYTAMEEEAKSTYLTTFTEELNVKLPMIDDTIITLLSTKTFNDLYTAAGKEALRQELLAKVQGQMPDYHLMSVYFTEFVVD